MYSDKYKNFAMRIHVELPDTASEENPLVGGWTYKAGVNDNNLLALFKVSEVDNPPPKVKSDSVNVPGANGSVYMAESTGRVYFEDKTVKVVLAAPGEEFSVYADVVLKQLRSNLQGRLMDFTFDDPSDVEWFHVGRLSADYDYKLSTFVFTFTEVKPFRYSTEIFQKTICLRPNYEKHNNADAWSFNTSAYGTPAFSSDYPGDFAYSEEPQYLNNEYTRTKAVGATPGSKMLLGIQTLVGGEVWFEDANGNKSKTYVTVTTPATPTQEHPGELKMHFTIDGSYYEWHTVDGTRKYLPTIRCTYSLSSYVPINSNGEIANSGVENVTFDFPSNVEVRPTVSGSAGIIIADGVAVPFDGSSRQRIVPRLVLPGANARKIGQESRSYFCWIPSTSADVSSSNTCTFRFIPVEVF